MMRISLLTIISCLSFQCFGQLIQDESYLDKSFWEFRAKLEYSVLQQDLDLFKTLLADTILESNDGCGSPGCGKDDFIRYYFANEGSSGKAWADMLKVIRFGFSREVTYTNLDFPVLHDTVIFQAPSYLRSIDSGTEVLILGEKVNIRKSPSVTSEVIQQASFEKFKCDCNIMTFTDSTYVQADGIGWLAIYLGDGRVGYVASELTSYAIIKHMAVSKVNGEWKIIRYYHAPGC